MRKKEIAIIDIRSSRITAVILSHSVNNTFDIKWSSDYSYSRYYERRFSDSSEVQGIITKILQSFGKYFESNDYELYVSVPGCFTNVTTKRRQYTFRAKKKVTHQDELKLQKDSMKEISIPGYSVIYCSPIVYELDDFRILYKPVGETSETLRASLSFVLCSNYFIGVIRPVLEKNGIKNYRLVPVVLAEGNYLIPEIERNRIAMLLDIGASSTTFSVVQGEGVLYEHSFDYGGDIITGELSRLLQVEEAEEAFEIAEDIKNHTSLSTIYDDEEKFNNIEGLKDVVYKKSAQQVIADCVNKIGDIVGDAIEDVAKMGVSCNKLYITGGGITYIRGAKELLSMRLNLPVEVVSPKMPHYDRPTESSYLSVADFVYKFKD